MATLEEGAAAVRIAREVIARSVSPSPPRDSAEPYRSIDLPPLFDAPMGVFVTLESFPSGDLRGCIGYPIPVFPLRVGLPRIARAAALEDPRFPPVDGSELPRLRIEVSLLTPPEPLESDRRSDLPGKIRIGVDGLIVDQGSASGLLLPQVAVEQGWDGITFVRQTCVKGGMRPDAWLSGDVHVRRFSSDRFREERPEGEVRAEPATVGGGQRSG